MYGLTETKRALYLPPDLIDQKPESVGIAIPGTEVWLEDEAGNRLGPEELGLLAKELAAASNPIEAARIKERLTRGFYGI